MESINNNNPNYQTAVKVATAGAAAGAAICGGWAFATQRNILKNPDEFIRKATAEIAKEKPFHTAFFEGTEEASKAALKSLDDALKAAVDFAKGGKYSFKGIAKNAGIGALAVGAMSLGAYGLYKLGQKVFHKGSEVGKQALKDGAKVVAEGMNEANATKTAET